MELRLERLLGIWVLWTFMVQYVVAAVSGDAAALMAFKASADPGHMLDSKWKSADHCKWQGVKECMNGRVTKLVLEYLHLNGTFAEKTLNRLDQLRVLSLKGNALTGDIPDLSELHNLKTLFLNENKFRGSLPDSISDLHRLKVIVLSDNALSGQIPVALTRLPRLYVLRLDNNRLGGGIPAFNQSGIRFFNVSNNRFSGPIPETAALSRFNSSSFSGNPGLCGEPIHKTCVLVAPVPAAPIGAISPETQIFFPLVKAKKSTELSVGQIAAIVVGSTVGLAALVFIVLFLCKRVRRLQQHSQDEERNTVGQKQIVELDKPEACNSDQYSAKSPQALDPQGSGRLMFCGGETQIYSLEDLLRASAEILGRGTLGSTYKAVMESGLIVSVKRLKNSNKMSRDEFERHMEMVGNLRHPNIVSLRAYFQAKEERLLVYDYYSNGSLYSLIHGTRSPGGKPLHWTSCLKIAEDVANGLTYLHIGSCRFIHGNLKSSNVLIGSDFEACVTDYGLTVFDTDQQAEDNSSLGYRAPECKSTRKMTSKADVYSFGVLLLEILTGKMPLQSVMNGHISDLPRWVRSVREEENEGVFDDSLSSSDQGSEGKLVMLLNIAMACVSPSPDLRPTMSDVLRMIQEAREAQANSSQSSDQSPARWSDTVHSLPREHGADRSFAERD
eukprot:Gb_35377 [translate_table: standard]